MLFRSARFRAASGTDVNPIWVKNGVDAQYFGTNTQSVFGTYTVSLGANDTVSVRLNSGTIQGGPDYHNLFAGHLLG